MCFYTWIRQGLNLWQGQVHGYVCDVRGLFSLWVHVISVYDIHVFCLSVHAWCAWRNVRNILIAIICFIHREEQWLLLPWQNLRGLHSVPETSWGEEGKHLQGGFCVSSSIPKVFQHHRIKIYLHCLKVPANMWNGRDLKCVWNLKGSSHLWLILKSEFYKHSVFWEHS